MSEENEFENISNEDPISTSNDGNSNIAAGASGETYDWSKAPDGAKAPPREDLDGKTLTITKADIILPPTSRPWSKTRAGDKDVKYCTFTLFYEGGQQERLSGVRVFNRDGQYSHPTITKDRKSQASAVLGLYADFKKKDINEVSLREFMGFLNSQPKVKIVGTTVENPETLEKVVKNLPGEFVSE